MNFQDFSDQPGENWEKETKVNSKWNTVGLKPVY